MKTKSLIIPFRAPSLSDDYLCADGELASFSNFTPVSSSAALNMSGGEPVVMKHDVSPGFPPPPDVRFSLRRAALPGWSIHPFTLPQKTVDVSGFSEPDMEKMALQLITDLCGEADERKLFTRPFLVLAAYRLNDGTHIVPSPPVLMIPNSQPPVVFPTENPQTGVASFSLASAICALQYRIVKLEFTQQWSSRISRLDFFISAPVDLFDPKGEMTAFRRERFAGFTHSPDEEGNAGEHPVCMATISSGWQPEAKGQETVVREISSIGSFHLITSLPVAALTPSSDFKDLTFDFGAFPSRSLSSPYRPDFRHLAKVEGKGAVEFSGRTTLFNLSLTPPDLFPLEQLTPFHNFGPYTPRFLFHPDPQVSSFPMVVDGKGLALPLYPHPSLFGSCFVAPLSGDIEDYPVPMASKSQPLHLPGAMWRSEGEERALLPDNLFMPLNIGEIYALCRAFRASGLVSTTAPTAYLFTSEGVFLLKETEEGQFKDAGLICRYRLGDRESLTVFGTSLTFSDTDGRLIRIEGTKVSVLSAIGNAAAGEQISLAGQGREGVLTTRPLKLGSPEELKRPVAIAVRGSFKPEEVELTLEGSFNLAEWLPVGRVAGPVISRLWAASFPFYRLSVASTLAPSEFLSCIVVQMR